jgi:deferrochelatase/peroxidase EfeB
MSDHAAFKRRQLLAGGAALSAGAALGRLTGGHTATAAPPPPTGLATRHSFEGARQAGVLTERPPFAIFAAFDSIAPSRAELAEALRALSARARRLTAPHDALLGAPGGGPTPDSGVLGARVPPDALTMTIGLGASLFDDRYGLIKPAALTPMPTFPDDALLAEETHGDILIQLCAGTQETLLNALRDLMRATRGLLAARWKVEGFLPSPTRERGAGRNLLGFKDGTSNPGAEDVERLVWTAEGGTYAVVRIIRNRVEFWDRVALSEQELMIGRDKATGAPLGRAAETDDPGYGDDPKGDRIPLDAHIRLARPRTGGTEDSRILRRSYNYSRGIDQAGQLDMGLVFCAFNRDPAKQFAKVQERLAGEPLIDYVVPTGGGYFYLPPGARGAQDWVGSGLF